MNEFDFYDDETEKPLEDIIQEQEEKEQDQKKQEQDYLSKVLEPLVSAVNATNEQLRTSNANTEILKGAIEMLQRAITTQGGENIADFLAGELSKHQKALANSGIDKLTETWEEQSKATKTYGAILEKTLNFTSQTINRQAKAIDDTINTQNEILEKFTEKADQLKPALEKPREVALSWSDRNALDTIGEKVSKAINKQKWWWVSWGVGILISVALAVWGVKSKVEAEKMLERATVVYSDHRYLWSFWKYLEEDWGKNNKNRYKAIREDFRKKYPDLIEQYKKENTDIVKEAGGGN